jgi:hypothetical protein
MLRHSSGREGSDSPSARPWVRRFAAAAGLLAALAVSLSLPASAQVGGPIPPTLAETDEDRAARPPLCSKVPHVGVIGFLVDQAWQSYRRLESSSPLRKGWCACARRCEPIDRFAAQEEKLAFRANELGHDPSVPPEQRAEYRTLAIRMFAARNRSVAEFRDCWDRSRPPISRSSGPHAFDATGQLTGKCSIDAKPLTVAQQWKVWCDAYQRGFDKIVAEFIQEFKTNKQMQAEVSFITRVSLNGAHRVRGGRVEPASIVGRGIYYQNRVLALLPTLQRSLPSRARLTWYEFKTRMTTKEIVKEPVDCPKF